MCILMRFCSSVIAWFSVACGNVNNFLSKTWKNVLAECKRVRTFCGLLRWTGACRFGWKSFFISHLIACFRLFWKSLKKGLIVGVWNAFSTVLLHGAQRSCESFFKAQAICGFSVFSVNWKKLRKALDGTKVNWLCPRLSSLRRGSLKVYLMWLSVLPSISLKQITYYVVCALLQKK